MPREPKFIFLDNIVRCELEDPDTHEIVVGEAKCMPQDMDMMSEKTGGKLIVAPCHNPVRNHTIKILRNKRKRTRQEYRVLKNLLKTYKNRPNFDTNDPYVRILKRKIYSYGQDIEYLNNCENNCREELKKYIDEKDNFYKKIRAMRKRDSNTDLN